MSAYAANFALAASGSAALKVSESARPDPLESGVGVAVRQCEDAAVARLLQGQRGTRRLRSAEVRQLLQYGAVTVGDDRDLRVAVAFAHACERKGQLGAEGPEQVLGQSESELVLRLREAVRELLVAGQGLQ